MWVFILYERKKPFWRHLILSPAVQTRSFSQHLIHCASCCIVFRLSLLKNKLKRVWDTALSWNCTVLMSFTMRFYVKKTTIFFICIVFVPIEQCINHLFNSCLSYCQSKVIFYCSCFVSIGYIYISSSQIFFCMILQCTLEEVFLYSNGIFFTVRKFVLHTYLLFWGDYRVKLYGALLAIPLLVRRSGGCPLNINRFHSHCCYVYSIELWILYCNLTLLLMYKCAPQLTLRSL